MFRLLKAAFFILMLTGVFAVGAAAQTSRQAVGAAEVNGTFEDVLRGVKNEKFSNELKILALGKGKIKIAFDLTYPFVDGTGEASANVGTLEGTADINGDTAVYTSDEFGQCKITIKFVKPGTVKVTQEGADYECGFGNNVTADGTYKKTSAKKPTFGN